MVASDLLSGMEYQGLNEKTIKIARYLKVLTEEQEKSMLEILPSINYSEIMDVINTFNPARRNEKIEKLKKK